MWQIHGCLYGTLNLPGVTSHSSMTKSSCEYTNWFQSQLLISNAGWTGSLQTNSLDNFNLLRPLWRRVMWRGRQEIWSGWVNRGGSSTLLRGVWSVEGHFVPRLIFVFTWHGRKLMMKGGSDYCLINTETEHVSGLNMWDLWVIDT